MPKCDKCGKNVRRRRRWPLGKKAGTGKEDMLCEQCCEKRYNKNYGDLCDAIMKERK